MSLLSALGRVFQRPLYTSDVMQMVQELKRQDPQLEARQLASRDIQWQAKTDRHTQAALDAGDVAQRPYPYQATGQ